MENQKPPKVIRLIKDTYLSMIHNSLDSRIFQNFYADVAGTKKDIVKGGELSCAFFVSSIATLFGLSKGIHGTVDGTMKDLAESGWVEITELRIGAIIVWEKENSDSGWHKHIGFYVGDNEAISNSATKKVPVRHNTTFNNKRKITNIFWNAKLN